jgi:hypothetical protein
MRNYNKSMTTHDVFTIHVHVHVGLLIAMTSGYYSHPDDRGVEDGLLLQLSTGEVVRADTSPTDIIIMVGAGSNEWFSPRGGSLRPVPHALQLDLGGDSRAFRSWLGLMVLPPTDAVLYKPRITYSTYRRRELMHLADQETRDSHFFSLACGDRHLFALQVQAVHL